MRNPDEIIAEAELWYEESEQDLKNARLLKSRRTRRSAERKTRKIDKRCKLLREANKHTQKLVKPQQGETQ